MVVINEHLRTYVFGYLSTLLYSRTYTISLLRHT